MGEGVVDEDDQPKKELTISLSHQEKARRKTLRSNLKSPLP